MAFHYFKLDATEEGLVHCTNSGEIQIILSHGYDYWPYKHHMFDWPLTSDNHTIVHHEMQELQGPFSI